jgi:hypothetical protein
MEPGLAEVRIPKWFMVYNHLNTVHAIASCNAADKDQARPGEGHHVAARTRPTGPAGFRADGRRL